MKSSGFSLIEVMIYSSLVCILSIIAWSWMAQVGANLHSVSRESAQIMMAHTILQRLQRDIQSADGEARSWQITPGKLQLRVNQQQVSWYLEKDKLYRVANGSKCLVANQLKSFKVGLKSGSTAESVECRIDFDTLALEHTIKVGHG